jgi:hypothetical protein
LTANWNTRHTALQGGNDSPKFYLLLIYSFLSVDAVPKHLSVCYYFYHSHVTLHFRVTQLPPPTNFGNHSGGANLANPSQDWDYRFEWFVILFRQGRCFAP